MNEYRKLPNKYEEPLSILLYKLINLTSNIITNKIHPNIITLCNILLRIYIIYNLQKNIYTYIPFYLLITCFLDYLDGYIARKYNMVTKLGDFLDHIGDTIFIIYIYYTIINRLNNKYKKINLLILFIFLIANFINLGCQEKYYSKDNSETLNILKKFCLSKNLLNYTKYFGCFTLHIFLGYICYNHNIFL